MYADSREAAMVESGDVILSGVSLPQMCVLGSLVVYAVRSPDCGPLLFSD